MGNIITEDNLNQHRVQQFNFETLDHKIENEGDDIDFQPMEFSAPAESSSYVVNSSNGGAVETREDLERRDQMINSLLDKVDSLSSELLKVQIKLEEQEGIFSDQIDEAKKRSYEDGLKQGQIEIEQRLQNQYSENLQNFTASVGEVNGLSQQLNSVMQSIEKELLKASIEIAKEVIVSELSFNSGQVAINLSKNLLEQVKDATDVKLHINSGDYDSIKDVFGQMENISVVPNRSVNSGGVIIVSDVGTIEGSVMERFKTLKGDILTKAES